MTGRVEIIIGCMFSGKSTELLRRCNRYKAIDKNVLLINHTNDTRTNNSVETHNHEVTSALKISSLIFLLPETLGVFFPSFIKRLSDKFMLYLKLVQLKSMKCHHLLKQS